MKDVENKDNLDSPAFPFEYHNKTGRAQEGFFNTGILASGASQQFAGMTLRDYFAAKAMQAAIAHYGFDGSHEHLAKGAYDTADAMLEEREK